MARGFALRSLPVQAVATAGTAVQINSGTSLLCYSVILTAEESNSGDIFVGASDVSSILNAKQLAAGESITLGFWSPIPQFELSSIWLDSSVSTDGCQVHFI